MTADTAVDAKRRPAIAAGQVVGYGLAVGLLLIALQELVAIAGSPWAAQFAFANGDLTGYLEGARRFLAGQNPYVAGPLMPHSFIHPPIALALFVPFLALPGVLWWAIPLVGTGALIAASRPSPWRLAVMAACLAWPRSIGAILAGNSDIWAMFFVALGARYRWPVALLAIKPTFAPLALIGLRDRRTWLVGFACLALSLPLLPSWLAVVSQIQGGLVYSLGGLPLVLLGGRHAMARRARPATGAIRVGGPGRAGAAVPLA